MKHIYLIVGPSGVGKTTVVEKMQHDYGYSVVSSFTDRPPRYEGETGHVFLTPEEFDKLPPLCAQTTFNNHRYGVTSEMVDQSDLYVIDVAGVQYLRTHYTGNKTPVVIGLMQNENVLLKRMIERGDSVEKAEERIKHDRHAFKNLKALADTLIEATDLQVTVNSVREYILFCEKYVAL